MIYNDYGFILVLLIIIGIIIILVILLGYLGMRDVGSESDRGSTYTYSSTKVLRELGYFYKIGVSTKNLKKKENDKD